MKELNLTNMDWKNIDTNPPAEGEAVFILRKNKPMIAYYCDGSFYYLEYDAHLGVLRKQHVSDTVIKWAEVGD